MSKQIIKTPISNDILFDLLKKINMNSNKLDNKYIINNYSFKLAKFKGYLQEFIKKIHDNYHVSKQYYLNRKLNYSKFITIIRQICKANDIPYTSEIVYNKSTYEINYYVYFCKK